MSALNTRPVSRRRFLVQGGTVLIGSSFTGTLLAACVGVTPSPSGAAAPSPSGAAAPSPSLPKEGAGTVQWLTGLSESAARRKANEDLLALFQAKNPDIEVKPILVPFAELLSSLVPRLQGANAPDLVTSDLGPAYAGPAIRAGLVQPLDDAYAEFGWNIFEWAKARATYDGSVYGVPHAVEEIGIFYNKVIFADLGFAEPKTLGELEAIAEAAKGRGLVPFAFGDKDQWPGGAMMSMVLNNLVGREGIEDLLFGDGHWNTPEVVRAIDIFFRQFAEKGYFPKDPVSIGYDDANALFYGGTAAMVPTGSWLAFDITERASFEAGFFLFPAIDGSGIVPTALLGGGWFVPANASNREGGLRLLDFLAQGETGRFYLERQNQIPTYPVSTEGLDLSPLFGGIVDDLGRLATSAGGGDFGYSIDTLAPQRFNDVWWRGLQEVLTGTRSPEELANAMEEAWQEAKEAGETFG